MRKMKDSGIKYVGYIPQSWSVSKNKFAFYLSKELVGVNFFEHQLLSLTTRGVIKKDINSTGGKLPESFNTYQKVFRDNIILCLFDLDVSAVFSGISRYDGMISPAYKIIECTKDILPDFGDYWFRMIGNDRSYLLYSKSLRNTINAEGFKDIPIILPNIITQHRIAAYLDEKVAHIDNIIDKTKKTIEEYKKYKQALITEAVTKGLNPDVKMKDSGVEWIGQIPEHWETAKLKYVFEIVKRISGELGYDVLSITQQGIKIKDIKNNEGQLSSDYSKYQFVNEGDYAMNHMDLLTGWVDLSKYSGVTSPDYRVFRLREEYQYSKEFYLYLFQTCYLNRVFYGMGQGVSNYGRWRLQADVFKNILLPVPPCDEQIKIAHYISGISLKTDQLIKQKQSIISELASYKKSLIYEVVTGKREVY